MSPRRRYLREHTAAAHARIDSLIGPLDSLSAYRRYLRAMFAFRAPIDRAFQGYAWPMALADWPVTPVASTMALDLADVDIARDAIDIAALPTDVSELLGILYVLEGSALGAKILFERAQQLGYSAEFGARHLAVQVASHDNWRLFIRTLESVEPLALDRIVTSAVDTFEAAERCFHRDDQDVHVNR